MLEWEDMRIYGIILFINSFFVCVGRDMIKRIKNQEDK